MLEIVIISILFCYFGKRKSTIYHCEFYQKLINYIINRYCECFAARLYCDGCNCTCCHNIPKYEEMVQKAVTSTLDRNPKAFKNKITYDGISAGVVKFSYFYLSFFEINKKDFFII